MAFIYTRRDKGNSAQRLGDTYKDYSVRDDQPGNHAERWPRLETLRRGWEMEMASQKASERGSEIHGYGPRRIKTQTWDRRGEQAGMKRDGCSDIL